VASRPAFEVLRFGGAAYLVYIGARLILQPRRDLTVKDSQRAGGRPSAGQAFSEGALCELSTQRR
jgi:threonine/homoserine/homoserine lactone efflux protein